MDNNTGFGQPTSVAATAAPAASAAPEARAAAPAPQQPVVPPKALRARRRRPAVILLSIALIAAGALGGAVLYQKTGQRVSVLALARDVPFGQKLSSADLKEAQISLDPALQPVGAASWKKATTMRATADLKAGSILTKAMLTRKPVLEPGQQVLPVAAKGGQLPAEPLAPGEKVIIESTPENDATGKQSPGKSFTGTVVRVGSKDVDGTTVVDVAVDPAQTHDLAPVVSSGKFLVVIGGRG